MNKIKVYDRALSAEFCQNIIDMFEDKTCCKVRYGNDLTYKIDAEDSPEWIKMINKLKESRDHFMNSYFTEFPELACGINCGGYEISRYSPISTSAKFYGITGKLSAVWFLNNIDVGGVMTLIEDNGKVDIRPEVGKLIIFPNDVVRIAKLAIGNGSKYLLINNVSPQ